MRSFINRSSHTLQASPDLMPLGAVLLALMMVFVFQLPQPVERMDYNIGVEWSCGDGIRTPLLVRVNLDENGEVRLDDRTLSRTGIASALTALRQHDDEYLTVELRVAPDAAYEDMVATVAAIKTAGVNAFGFVEY